MNANNISRILSNVANLVATLSLYRLRTASQFLVQTALHLGEATSLEKKCQRDTSKMQDYQAFLEEYLDLGHMSIAQTPSAYVIPHTSVFKKGSNQIRVVFNASAPDIDGISLNDRLSTGPKLQSDLSKIISKFRTHSRTMHRYSPLYRSHHRPGLVTNPFV
ncbi:hypothetical protein AAG570_012796 [Ranatra chinensis]|uniref:Uncharacterized protein n=1 Tax=Ranatra chinensis TaxID=642074 RepID=A0ABD0YRB4_9HEMI